MVSSAKGIGGARCVGTMWPPCGGTMAFLQRQALLMTTPTLWALRVVSFFLGVGVFIGVSYMETQVYPVVDGFRITQVSRSQRTIALTGYLHKQRKCTFIGLTAHGIYKGERVGDLNVSYARKDFNGVRGPGTYDWGPVLISLPEHVEDIDALDINALHNCHPVWATRSHVAAIPISPY